MLFIIYLTGTIISAIFFLIGLHKYRTRKALLKLETVTTGVIKSVEKPKLEDAPSNLAVLGRYVLTPEIFDAFSPSASNTALANF